MFSLLLFSWSNKLSFTRISLAIARGTGWVEVGRKGNLTTGPAVHDLNHQGWWSSG